MKVEEFLERLKAEPEKIEFPEVMAVIDPHYQFTETTFSNAGLVNEAGKNSGSCKIFAFGKIHKLSKEETLALFGQYYREDVLKHPEAEDHQNIRHFIKTGWDGITFSGDALQAVPGI